MASKFAFRVLLMLSFSGAPILARPAACTDLVECEHEGNSTLHGATHSPPKPLLPNHCPGKPECSGHGQCQRPNPPMMEPTCRCAQGFFGRDCSRQQRDCTKLRSCTDCNHAANGKFCGWCADSRYCVPKHVHKMLAHKGKACTAWYDDKCPRNSSTALGVDANGYSIFEEWGDDRSVALAEALIALIDGSGGEGTSGTLGTLISLMTLGLVALCTLREKRAAERRKRFEEFMKSDESETLQGGLGSPTPFKAPHYSQLGPAWTESTGMHESVLADALGTAAPHPTASSLRMPPREVLPSPQPAGDALLEPYATLPPAAPENDEAVRQSMRDAARRDIEERKERRRAAAEDARNEALRAERAVAEERVRAQLQAKAGLVQEPMAASVKPAAPPLAALQPPAAPPPQRPPTVAAQDAPTATLPDPAKPAGAAPALIPPAVGAMSLSLAQAEAEFLDALDDL